MWKAIRNLKVGQKLYISFGLVLAIMLALSILSYFNFSKQNEATRMNDHTYNVLMELNDLLASMVNMETGQRGFALTGNDASLEPYHEGMTSFNSHMAILKELTSDNPKQQELLNRIQVVGEEWQAIAAAEIEFRKQVAAGSASIEEVIAREQAAKGKNSFDQFRSLVTESENIELALLAERAQASENRQQLTNLSLVIGTALAMLVALILAIAITRMITRPIQEANEAAQAMASGNLDVDINIRSNDEIGLLSRSFQLMADSMNEVLTNINQSADQVTSGAKQVSDSSMALSQGAAEQASSIEELTASMEEIGTQTDLNAQRASEANSLANAAKSKAIEGNEQMKSMLHSMDEINEASSNISKIIKVIDEIAFQTNILALNAAVEAARAGQHGKGFAVVAEEVRNLAARSASAAKETTDLIEGSIKKVEDGTHIANETATALNEIVNGVTTVADLVDQIAQASNEQASGIGQINQAILQVSQVTQTNSATSEESATASEELASQAQVLKDLVSRFNLKRGSGPYAMTGHLSGDIRQMFDRMSRETQRDSLIQHESSQHEEEQRKIVLSDQEFGKYS